MHILSALFNDIKKVCLDWDLNPRPPAFHPHTLKSKRHDSSDAEDLHGMQEVLGLNSSQGQLFQHCYLKIEFMIN